MTYSFINIFLLTIWAANVQSARILCVFPSPSLSHHFVFRELTNELANNGHELVVITSNAIYAKNNVKNITEIDISELNHDFRKRMKRSKHTGKRGVIMGKDVMLQPTVGQYIAYQVSLMFSNTKVKELINDKTQKFDLVLAEAKVDLQLMFAKIFNVPAIIVSSFGGYPEHYEIVGAPNHPFLYPHLMRNKFRNLNIMEKVMELYYEIKLYFNHVSTVKIENHILRKYFGNDAPTISELRKYVHMIFLNTHPIMDNNRPVPPNVIYLGAMHLKPVKELPQDLKEYLDQSKQGVVYVSFGSNARPANMDDDLLDDFLETFKALPYNILWKFDEEEKPLKRRPNNLRTEKWFPQRDLLAHPNIKVFITQGGLQSTDEAIDAAVPVIGIPMFSDQWYNTNKYEELGIGKYVEGVTLTAEILTDAINNVIEDKSYKQNMIRIRSIIKDQPQTPVERAVWWTEFLLRHGGTEILRNPAHNMSWREYYELDLVLLLSLCSAISSLIIGVSTYYLMKYIKRVIIKKRKVE